MQPPMPPLSMCLHPLLKAAQEVRARVRQKSEAMRALQQLRNSSGMQAVGAALPEPVRRKCHWDYVLEEGQWLATDMHQEHRWHLLALRQVAAAAAAAARRRQARLGAKKAKVAAAAASCKPAPLWAFPHLPAPPMTPGTPTTAQPWQWQYLPLAGLCREANVVSQVLLGPDKYPHLPPSTQEAPRLPQQVAPLRFPGQEAHAQSAAATSMLRAAMASVAKFVLPPPLRAALRPYQRVGLQWLLAHAARGCGAVLGDERGLGKRAVAVAAIGCMVVGMATPSCLPPCLVPPPPPRVKAKAQHALPVLVLVPDTLVPHWRAEFRRWWPALRVGLTSPPPRSGVDVQLLAVSEAEAALREAGKKAASPWSMVVVDATVGVPTAASTALLHVGSGEETPPEPSPATAHGDGQELPWEALAKLPTCHRLLVTNRLLPTEAPLVHQVAAFVCPRSFAEHSQTPPEAVLEAMAESGVKASAPRVADEGDAPAPATPEAPTEPVDLTGDGAAVRDALLCFFLRRQVQDEAIPPQLPTLWCRTLLLQPTPAQRRVYASLCDVQAVSSDVHAACGLDPDMSPLLRRMALLHAAAQHAAGPSCLAEGASSSLWAALDPTCRPQGRHTPLHGTAQPLATCAAAALVAAHRPSRWLLRQGEGGLGLLQGRRAVDFVDGGAAGQAWGGWGLAAVLAAPWGEPAPDNLAFTSEASGRGRGRSRQAPLPPAEPGSAARAVNVHRLAVGQGGGALRWAAQHSLPLATPLRLTLHRCHTRGVLPLTATASERAVDVAGVLGVLGRGGLWGWSAPATSVEVQVQTRQVQCLPAVPPPLACGPLAGHTVQWDLLPHAVPTAWVPGKGKAAPPTADAITSPRGTVSPSPSPALRPPSSLATWTAGSAKFRVLHQLLHEAVSLGVRLLAVASSHWMADAAAAFANAAGFPALRLDTAPSPPGVMGAEQVERFNCDARWALAVTAVAPVLGMGPEGAAWSGKAVLGAGAARGDVGNAAPLPYTAGAAVVLDAAPTPACGEALRGLLQRLSAAGVSQVVQLATAGTLEEGSLRLASGGGSAAVTAAARALGWTSEEGDDVPDYPCDPASVGGAHARLPPDAEVQGLLPWQSHVRSKAMHGTSAVWAGTNTSAGGMVPPAVLAGDHPRNVGVGPPSLLHRPAEADTLASSLLSMTRGLPLQALREAQVHALLAGWVLRPAASQPLVDISRVSPGQYEAALATARRPAAALACTHLPATLSLPALAASMREQVGSIPPPTADKAPLAHLWPAAASLMRTHPAHLPSWQAKVTKRARLAPAHAPSAGKHLWYDVPRVVGGSGALARGPMRWLAGLVEELSRHQDAGLLHTSHVYAPPHPEQRSLYSSVSVLGDSAAAAGLRNLLHQLEQSAMGLYLHPLHVRAEQRFYGPAAAVGAGGGTGAAHSVAALTSGTYTSQSFYAHQVPQRPRPGASAPPNKYGAGDGALFDRPSHSYGWSSCAATSLRWDEEAPSTLTDKPVAPGCQQPSLLHLRFGGSAGSASLTDVALEIKRLASMRTALPRVTASVQQAGGWMLDGGEEEGGCPPPAKVPRGGVLPPLEATVGGLPTRTPAAVVPRPRKRRLAPPSAVGVDSWADMQLGASPPKVQAVAVRAPPNAAAAGAASRADALVAAPLRKRMVRGSLGIDTRAGGVTPLPASSRSDWAQWEDALLLQVVREFGSNWDLVRGVMAEHPAAVAHGGRAARAPRLLYERHRRLTMGAVAAGRSLAIAKRAKSLSGSLGTAYAQYGGDVSSLGRAQLLWGGKQLGLWPRRPAFALARTVADHGSALATAMREEKQIPSVVSRDATDATRQAHASHEASVAAAALRPEGADAAAPTGIADAFFKAGAASLHGRLRVEPFRESSPYVLQHAEAQRTSGAAGASGAAYAPPAPQAQQTSAGPPVTGTTTSRRLKLRTAGAEAQAPAPASAPRPAATVPPPPVAAPPPAVQPPVHPTPAAPVAGAAPMAGMAAMLGGGGSADQSWLNEVAQRPEVRQEINRILSSDDGDPNAKVTAIADLLRRYQRET